MGENEGRGNFERQYLQRGPGHLMASPEQHSNRSRVNPNRDLAGRYSIKTSSRDPKGLVSKMDKDHCKAKDKAGIGRQVAVGIGWLSW